jgi:hypothetical protein
VASGCSTLWYVYHVKLSKPQQKCGPPAQGRLEVCCVTCCGTPLTMSELAHTAMLETHSAWYPDMHALSARSKRLDLVSVTSATRRNGTAAAA